jgi:hypothetical protein
MAEHVRFTKETGIEVYCWLRCSRIWGDVVTTECPPVHGK